MLNLFVFRPVIQQNLCMMEMTKLFVFETLQKPNNQAKGEMMRFIQSISNYSKKNTDYGLNCFLVSLFIFKHSLK